MLYAPILNLTDEKSLDGTTLVVRGKGSTDISEGMGRPGVLLVGADRSLVKGLKRRDRETIFLGRSATPQGLS